MRTKQKASKTKKAGLQIRDLRASKVVKGGRSHKHFANDKHKDWIEV